MCKCDPLASLAKGCIQPKAIKGIKGKDDFVSMANPCSLFLFGGSVSSTNKPGLQWCEPRCTLLKKFWGTSTPNRILWCDFHCLLSVFWFSLTCTLSKDDRGNGKGGWWLSIGLDFCFSYCLFTCVFGGFVFRYLMFEFGPLHVLFFFSNSIDNFLSFQWYEAIHQSIMPRYNMYTARTHHGNGFYTQKKVKYRIPYDTIQCLFWSIGAS